MERCETCGTENREGAKFCRGCARPLLPIPANADAASVHSNRALRCGVCQAIHARDASECVACGNPLVASQTIPTPEAAASGAPARPGRWFGLLALFVVITGLGVWALGPTTESREKAEAASQVDPQPAGLAAPVPAEPEEAAAPVAATLGAAEKAHFEELVKREAERAEKARQTVARLAAQEKAAKEARAARAAAERQRKEEASQAIDPPAVSARAGASQPLQGEVVAPAPATPPRQSVEQACASASNFIARDLCRVDACRDTGNARDPICVWYRQLEEERRNRLSN